MTDDENKEKETYLGTTTIGGNPADLVEDADGGGSVHVAVPNKDPEKGTDFQHTSYGSDGGYKGHVTEHAGSDGQPAEPHDHGDTSRLPEGEANRSR